MIEAPSRRVLALTALPADAPAVVVTIGYIALPVAVAFGIPAQWRDRKTTASSQDGDTMILTFVFVALALFGRFTLGIWLASLLDGLAMRIRIRRERHGKLDHGALDARAKRACLLCGYIEGPEDDE